MNVDENKILRLEKENKQMRKALEKIANVGSWKKDLNGVWRIGNKPVFQVAQEGLKGIKND